MPKDFTEIQRAIWAVAFSTALTEFIIIHPEK
jgi:hypothetical protein